MDSISIVYGWCMDGVWIVYEECMKRVPKLQIAKR